MHNAIIPRLGGPANWVSLTGFWRTLGRIINWGGVGGYRIAPSFKLCHFHVMPWWTYERLAGIRGNNSMPHFDLMLVRDLLWLTVHTFEIKRIILYMLVNIKMCTTPVFFQSKLRDTDLDENNFFLGFADQRSLQVSFPTQSERNLELLTKNKTCGLLNHLR